MTQPVRQGICRAPQQEGRLEAGETFWNNTSNPDRLRGQRLPYAIFFGYFLAWLQESDTHNSLSDTNEYLFRIFILPEAAIVL